jgi:hypothetical protein
MFPFLSHPLPKDTHAAMSHPNECVETIKEVMAEVMREKNALVGRLNAMHQRIVEEEDPVTKVRRKVEWASTRDRSVEALNEIVASLRRALEEDESSTHGSTGSLRSSASSASSPSFTNEHASSMDRNQAVFEQTAKSDPDFSYEAPQEVGAAAFRLPARLDKDDGGQGFRPRAKSLGCVVQVAGFREPVSSPATKAAGFFKRVSSEASLLPQQVRKSVRNSARRFSSSMLRRVGWSPALQDSQWVWEQRVKNGYGI